MDRRSFLTLLGAVGVLTPNLGWLLDARQRQAVVPGLPEVEALFEDGDVSPWLGPRDLAVWGREKTFEVGGIYRGSADVDEVGVVRLTRLLEDGGDTLAPPLFMRAGGWGRWCAGPGEEIPGPVRIVVSECIDAWVIGTDRLGRKVMANQNGAVPLYPAGRFVR